MELTKAKQVIASSSPAFAAGLLLLSGGCVFAVATPNPMVTLTSVGCLVLIGALLWREEEPPIFLFILFFHWLQSSIAVFYADILGQRLQTTWPTPRFEDALLLSLAACAILAIGIRCSIAEHSVDRGRMMRELRMISFERVLVLYAALFALSLVARVASGVVPGLHQPLLTVCSLRWAPFFLLALITRENPSKRPVFFVIIAIEILVGASAFFSSFKTPLFLVIIALLTGRRHVSHGQLFRVACVGSLLFALGVYWLAVRGEYRENLNAGSGQQVVTLPFTERLRVLGGLLTSVDGDDLGQAAHDLAKRVQYVDYFAACLNRVPSVISHTDGQFHLETAQHVLMPRILFPDKAAQIDESFRTTLYTGRQVAGRKRGTSISIGYFGQMYVEIGYFMLALIFFYGLLWGILYRILLKSCRYQSIGICVIVATFISNYHIEFSITQLLGGTAMRFLVGFTVLFLFGERIGRYLLEKPNHLRIADTQ